MPSHFLLKALLRKLYMNKSHQMNLIQPLKILKKTLSSECISNNTSKIKYKEKEKKLLKTKINLIVLTRYRVKHMVRN